MTIHFNPFYDEWAYTDLQSRGGLLFDSKTVGPMGLLSELEERLGLAGRTFSDMERMVFYIKAMRVALQDNPDIFYKDSFQNDEVGTARTLLQWRDAAILAGWDPSANQPSNKFKGLAAIETAFDKPGYADRWINLRDYLSGLDHINADLSIESHCSNTALDPYIQAVLKRLSELGVAVNYNPAHSPSARKGSDLYQVQQELLNTQNNTPAADNIQLTQDGSIRILRFPDYSDAQQWAAAELPDSEQEVLLVNGDNSSVSDIIFSLGKPTLASSVSVDSTAAQLFRLGIALFKNPVDVNSLLAYLRLPVNPIGAAHVQKQKSDGTVYYRSLNHELADSLLTTGGISEWDKIISSAVYDSDGNSLDKNKMDAIRARLYMWDKSKDKKVQKKDVLEYLDNIVSWCASYAYLKQDPSWNLIKELTNAFRLLLENESDVVSVDKLLNWSFGLSLQSVMPFRPAQAGSIPAIRNIRSILDSPKNVVWLDCVGAESEPYAYDFMSPSEMEMLKGGILDKNQTSALSYRAMVESVCRISQSLTLVTYDTDHGEKTQENPFIIELKTRFGIKESQGVIPDALMEVNTVTEPVGKKLVHNIDAALIARKKERESYSSLSLLFQNPFDYVLEYLLQYGSYGEDTIVNVDAVRGTVAHKYIEELINDSGKDIKLMSRTHNNDFENRILKTAQDVGAILLLDENKLEFGKIKTSLQKSVSNLLEFIDRNNLSIVAPEYEINTTLPVIGKFLAYIDLLLINNEGKYVIVDFKWSEGSHYANVLENNRILQLALYAAAVEKELNAQVINYGYYILPRYKFHTTSYTGLNDITHVNLITPKSNADVFVQACNSYTYRMDQLKQGIIEEAEGLKLADLQYAADTSALNLYPLATDYHDESVKDINRWGKNIILKGGLE